jgi:hypothetical protein
MVTRSRSRVPELPRDIWELIFKYKTEAFQRDLDDEWHQEMMDSWLGELEWRDWLKHGYMRHPSCYLTEDQLALKYNR